MNDRNKYAGTRTEHNLWEAFAGESQAGNKLAEQKEILILPPREKTMSGRICMQSLQQRRRMKVFRSSQRSFALSQR